jgi:predicted metal-dependent hydrolase
MRDDEHDMLELPGSPAVQVKLRRSPRARRLSLRVSGVDGRVTLSLPQAVPLASAREFLDRQADWVRGHLADRPTPWTPRVGGVIPVGGRDLPIVAGPRSRLRAGRAEVRDGRPAGPQLAGLLKAQARVDLAAACDRFAARLGRPYSALVLRDTRSRWGSCSSTGRLMFSWRLVMAPPEVLDYVAAHEVAHLAEMNHGKAFWAEVARLCPDYAPRRRWLRDHGAVLHGIRFTP